jgi:predicted PurR-regulated permease PerM
MNTPFQQNRFWLLALVVFVALLWLLKPMLLPFIAGVAIAYFFNPVVDALTRRKIPRWLATFFVLFGFVLFMVLLLLLIAPLLQSQLSALIDTLPVTIMAFRDHLVPWAEGWLGELSPENVEGLRGAASQLAGNAAGWAGTALKGIISEGAALFNIVALVIVTPVVAFFVLRDWPRMASVIDTLFPRKHHELIRTTLQDIDRALSGFVRGQALVCLSLGLIYSIGLSLTGLKYGITIGIIAGVLSFIPYVGSGFMLVTSMLLAFVQFDSRMEIARVFLVYIVGQALEGYVLTPKLVGDRVGLHPVWIIFALFAGGSLLGFVGVLIAVPVAAIIGVLVRLALRLYRMSPVYHGAHSSKAPAPPAKK